MESSTLEQDLDTVFQDGFIQGKSKKLSEIVIVQTSERVALISAQLQLFKGFDTQMRSCKHKAPKPDK